MAEPKTKPTAASATEFINSVADEERRADSLEVLKIMERVTGEKPVMWGTAIVGFGKYELAYSNGKTADWPLIGFSPRKQSLVLYTIANAKKQAPLFAKLGKHSIGKSCLYIKRLSDVDKGVLEKLIAVAWDASKKKYNYKK